MRNTLHIGGGMDFLNGRQGARKDFFAPFLFSLWTGAGADLPLEPNESERSAFTLGTYVQFPSIVDHHVVGLGIDTTYTPWFSSGSQRPAPRGGFAFEATDQKASFLAAFDYRFNIAIIDFPLPYGFSVDQLAGGVFLESAALWDGSSMSLLFDNILYPGVELIFSIGSVNHIPVGIGFAARIAPLTPAVFSAREDMRMYLFAGRGGFQRGSLKSSFLDDHTSVSYPMAR